MNFQSTTSLIHNKKKRSLARYEKTHHSTCKSVNQSINHSINEMPSPQSGLVTIHSQRFLPLALIVHSYVLLLVHLLLLSAYSYRCLPLVRPKITNSRYKEEWPTKRITEKHNDKRSSDNGLLQPWWNRDVRPGWDTWQGALQALCHVTP